MGDHLRSNTDDQMAMILQSIPRLQACLRVRQQSQLPHRGGRKLDALDCLFRERRVGQVLVRCDQE